MIRFFASFSFPRARIVARPSTPVMASSPPIAKSKRLPGVLDVLPELFVGAALTSMVTVFVVVIWGVPSSMALKVMV